MTSFQTKDDLFTTLNKVQAQVESYFLELPLEHFYLRPSGKWRAADDLCHLTISSKTLARALKIPKLLLSLRFGHSNKPSHTYETLSNKYQTALHKGAQATGRYIPPQNSSNETNDYRDQLIKEWKKVNEDLRNALSNWNDSELEKYLLPHPILGKLTVKEMFMFIHLHNLHHVTVVKSRLEQNSSGS